MVLSSYEQHVPGGSQRHYPGEQAHGPQIRQRIEPHRHDLSEAREPRLTAGQANSHRVQFHRL